jgi:ABC-2 type transport system ATP-binding protein
MPGVLALESQALAKTYRGVFSRRGQQALRGLDLTVPAGVAFGLIGPNGAGKTTFIKLLLGVARPTSGSVRVLGGDPEDLSVRRRIGYLPERLHLPRAFTPRQYLASVARLKGVALPGRELLALLGRVGLGAEAGRRIGGFSKGMRQRLGLAAALVGAPELLVLDEPTDGIDPIGRMEVRALLAEERARGATIFLNSHLLAETERVCDRVAILAAGRLVREGTLEELCGNRQRWRVRFAPGAPAALLEAAGFRASPVAGQWTVEADEPAALNAALDRARAAGALMVELGRDAQELEEVLADSLGRAA